MQESLQVLVCVVLAEPVSDSDVVPQDVAVTVHHQRGQGLLVLKVTHTHTRYE